MSEQNDVQQTAVGQVVSDKMDKTVVVMTERRVRHPVYGKYIRRSTRLKVHDENNQCAVGDTVRIKQTRPMAKGKSWTLVDIVSQSAG